MRRGLIFLVIICFVTLTSTKVHADPIPDAVMKPYKASIAALKNKDIKTASQQAKNAWQQAETLLGDSKTTGDLALNYGLLAIRVPDLKSAAKALERSADLAHLAKKDAGLIRLEREEGLVSVLIAMGKKEKANRRANAALKFADANDIGDTVFAGEIMVHKARLIAGQANSKAKNTTTLNAKHISQTGKRSPVNRTQWRSAQYARTAIDIFDKNPELARKAYSAIAYKLIGFSHERDKEWLKAALVYQKAMKIQKTIYTMEDDAYVTTIGRWINARNYLLRERMKYKASKEERKIAGKSLAELGICRCWPYDNQRPKRAKAIKRVPPKMPSKASTSGFSIIEFDLDDAGNVINPEIMFSWPKKMYDKSSLRALKKWKYESVDVGNPKAQRKGLRTVMHYYLSDWNRKPI